MKAEMATRNPTNVNVSKEGCTDFVMHKSQQTAFAGIQKKIIDYTEHKLIRFASTIKNKQQKLTLMAIIEDYVNGLVAVAWRRGQPVYIRITKNA